MTNTYEVRGDVTVIFCKRKGEKHEVLIDTADLPTVAATYGSLQIQPGLNTFYAGAVMKKRHTALHRLLLDPPKGMVVDHINHNGLDNRRSNMRVVTPRENSQNICDAGKRNLAQGRIRATESLRNQKPMPKVEIRYVTVPKRGVPNESRYNECLDDAMGAPIRDEDGHYMGVKAEVVASARATAVGLRRLVSSRNLPLRVIQRGESVYIARREERA